MKAVVVKKSKFLYRVLCACLLTTVCASGIFAQTAISTDSTDVIDATNLTDPQKLEDLKAATDPGQNEADPQGYGQQTGTQPPARQRGGANRGGGGGTQERTRITILNAVTSGNRKDPSTGDDLLIFTGNVRIVVEKGGSKTNIAADVVSYNRAREMLYASGSVRLDQTDENGSTQNVTSDSLLFNAVTLEGIFDNSRVVQASSNAINLPSGSSISVSSEVFARDASGTIAFKNGSLTFCEEDEIPHWRIKASRIWLLPGQEFAFLNAVIYVGALPVLWFPAFYYPKDELIFNPVFSYRNRAGYIIQTTTYLYGRKPLQDPNINTSADQPDYFSFIRPTQLMEQKREGLVLHNLDTPYTGDTSNYVKFMLDWYSNIGIGTGVEGAYVSRNAAPSVEAGFLLGFSRSVFNPYALYFVPYSPSGKMYNERSSFLGVDLPFRYRAKMVINGSVPFNYSLNIPIYSDPFFNYDFGERSETMDWLTYIVNNPTMDNSDKTEKEKMDAAEVTSFSWNTNLSYNIPLPDVVKPYINTLAISSLSANIYFSQKDVPYDYPERAEDIASGENWYEVNANRRFFYPSSVTPLNLSLRADGTILSFGSGSYSYGKRNKQPVLEMDKPALFAQTDDNEADNENANTNNENEDDYFNPAQLVPPLKFSAPVALQFTMFSYNLGYSFTPEFSSQISYSSVPLQVGGDFKWERYQSSYIQMRAPFSLNQSINYGNNFASMTNSVTLDPLYQTHPYISTVIEEGGYSEYSKLSLQETDLRASYLNVLNDNTVAIRPFVFYPHFKDTGLSWNTSIKLMRSEFIGSAEQPEWDYLTVDWNDPDAVTTHTVEAKVAANEFSEKFEQSATFTATLPPQVEKYYALLNFRFPYFNTSVETGIARTSLLDPTWRKEQLRQSATLSFFNSKLQLTESFNYELEEDYPDSLRLALSYAGLQAAYTMRYTDIYDFDNDTGWFLKNTEREFVPYSMSLAYTASSKGFKLWKSRIEIIPGIDTSVVYDFIRPTNSYFIFSPSLTFRINRFLYLKFSATSRNSSIYRYFQEAMGHPGRLAGETNMFVDLINGFRFDNEQLRRSSGFKLQSFDLLVSHDLHDWDFNMRLRIQPRLITDDGASYYDFSPYFMISVVWRPLNAFKAKIEDKYGEFLINGPEVTF